MQMQCTVICCSASVGVCDVNVCWDLRSGISTERSMAGDDQTRIGASYRSNTASNQTASLDDIQTICMQIVKVN